MNKVAAAQVYPEAFSKAARGGVAKCRANEITEEVVFVGITDEDWAGWVQERGLYFPTDDADPRYARLLTMSDDGEVAAVDGVEVRGDHLALVLPRPDGSPQLPAHLHHLSPEVAVEDVRVPKASCEVSAALMDCPEGRLRSEQPRALRSQTIPQAGAHHLLHD